MPITFMEEALHLPAEMNEAMVHLLSVRPASEVHRQ